MNKICRIKNITTANIGLAIWRLKCFYETFVQGSTAVILLNFCAKIPPHRQAANRYRQFYLTVRNKILYLQCNRSSVRLEHLFWQEVAGSIPAGLCD